MLAQAGNTRRGVPVLPQDDFRTSLILPECVPLLHSYSVHIRPSWFHSSHVQPSLPATHVPMFGFIPFSSLFASFGGLKLNGSFSLTRRFSLLQSSAGDTSLSGLKEGFAEQRSRNASNAITEEEEDLVLDALHKMRTGYSVQGGMSSDGEDEEDHVLQNLRSISGRGTSDGQSRHSGRSNTASGTDPASPGRTNGSARTSKANKRYSNNLFVGSGQFRDQTYLRSVGSIPRQTSNRSMASTASRRGAGSAYSSPRPSTPEVQSATSAPSSPNDSFGSKEELGTVMPVPRSAPLTGAYPYTTTPTSVAAHRLSRSFSPSTLSRVSASLDEVLNRLEEAGEDEILLPRKSMTHTVPEHVQAHSSSGSSSGHVRLHDRALINVSNTPQVTAEHASGTAISADRPISEEGVFGRVASPVPRSGAASPTPRLPGYIPGMPRPMTPRNFELHDELRSHSTTPRAISPTSASPSPHLPARLFRRGSDASGVPSRPESPAVRSPSFIHRSTNGRFTPGGDDYRRPTSPLAGQSIIGVGLSRPTTPSRITWTPTHSRNGSIASSTDLHGSARSLRSPALPDSPLIDATIGGGPLMASLTAAASRNMRNAPPRPPSAMSGFELGADASSFRADTPSRNGRSPAPSALALGRAQSPRHTSTSSTPFSLALGSPHSTAFGALDNSSRSSLASEGSSYHSDEEGQRARGPQLFLALEPEQGAWHDIPEKDDQAEAVVRQLAGLTLQDFAAIQDKVLEAAQAKPISPEMQRSPSLRKRKGSIARSIHSLNESPVRLSCL
jgi:serine/arginine repetitive matrix protein 2